MTELLGCPFCGSARIALRDAGEPFNPINPRKAAAVCLRCGAIGPVACGTNADVRATAARRWNTRTAQEPGGYAPVAGTSGGGSATREDAGTVPEPVLLAAMRREYEDSILAEAEMIRRRRAQEDDQ